ncbi:DUF2652 domain-containing protein [uncultured Psychroserpens sp.]|uniref:DUF2652 domain-containing protein n=1 Tax=uncultured Psychroserpens sp. TaxID=255436 RepID=UPI00261393D6|nr:DUF2652 domain-containing protein [uncultured Psychroserpens sp.]
MEQEPILICIPDISGFTRFMSETDAEFSSKIIPSLLNKIIYSNEIGLRVSEIEGDAVLFYRKGPLPSLKRLIDQCTRFYKDFYKQLDLLYKANEHDKDGKKIPQTLGLKIILHFGLNVDAVQIGKHIKLMGEDIVIAHKLLKNDIPHEEYILLSNDLISKYDFEEIETKTYWASLKKGGNFYEHLGEIGYAYINLSPLV